MSAQYTGPSMEPLAAILRDTARPSFLFGCTPPRDGTTDEKALEACSKFTSRSSVLATDGFIVYDIQDESSRTAMDRPFPFRKTMDPAKYASLFPGLCGKECVVYKAVGEESEQSFKDWLSSARTVHGHSAFNLVGAASSQPASATDDKEAKITLARAGQITSQEPNCGFGCVCIPERHTSKGNEDLNMLKKINFGCEWFITQGIFASEPVIKLVHDYSAACKKDGVTPKKIILTFAPCGRAKTMYFIKWLGMHVPTEVEQRLFPAVSNSSSGSSAELAVDHVAVVQESMKLHMELLARILEQTAGSGVPLGINVESLSIFKEEIDAAHTLFQSLQTLVLNGRGSPWSVRWIDVKLIMSRDTSKSSRLAIGDEANTAATADMKKSGSSGGGGGISNGSSNSNSRSSNSLIELAQNDSNSNSSSSSSSSSDIVLGGSIAKVELVGADNIELDLSCSSSSSSIKISVAELKALLSSNPDLARQIVALHTKM